MTKTLNQIIFFLHQNQNIFFSNIGNQNIFLEKKPYPKLNGPSLTVLLFNKCAPSVKIFPCIWPYLPRESNVQ